MCKGDGIMSFNQTEYVSEYNKNNYRMYQKMENNFTIKQE